MDGLGKPMVSYLDAAFVLLVTGAAWLWPPLALVVGGAFFVATAYVNDKRSQA